MTPEHYTVPSEMFRALVTGDRTGAVTDRLRSARLSKSLLLLRDLVRAAVAGRPADAALARDAYQRLSRVQRQAPAAFRAALTYPGMGARVLRHAADDHPVDAPHHRLAVLAAVAAVHGGIPTELPVPVGPSGEVVLPSLGTALLSAAADPVVLRSDGRSTALHQGRLVVPIAELPGSVTDRWFGTPTVTLAHRGHRWTVLVDHVVPRTVPDVRHDRRPLSAVELAEWTARLAEGWRLLVEHHPAMAREVADTVRMITPLAGGPDRPASATLSDLYGCVLMTMPADDVTCAVTLIHECQHSKLSALQDLLPLVATDTPDRYYAPWREDPRPAPGLLHGVYAHSAIAGFWHRQREITTEPARLRHADIEYLRWRSACLDAARTLLDSGLLTEAGTLLVTETVRELTGWSATPILPGTDATARRAAADHLARWRVRNGEPNRTRMAQPSPE